MELQDIFKQIEKDYDEVRKLNDNSLYYDRMDWLNCSFTDDESEELIGDIYNLQILIEQIIRFGNIVKRNILSPNITLGE